MSFFTLPPEINSLRMFLGAGSAPMLEAAAAWDGLAAELGTAAQSFGSVISNLAGQAWQGPASAAMAAAAAPYAGWLAAAASQSQGAAGQARSVVSAFEQARAATIHPGAVDQNRNAFVNLVMSNLFGQNAPLIALAESIYEEMWAADVTAMTSYYAGAAAAAAQVVPWQNVLQTFPALAGGVAGGISAVAHGSGAAGDASPAAGGGAVAAAGPTGAAAAAGGGGASAGGVGSTDAGLAPASYASGDAGAASYTGATAGSTDVSGAVGATPAAYSAGAGVGIGGLAMAPMMMAGLARAGLLNDGPGMAAPVPPKAAETEEEAAKKAQEAEATEAEATEAAEVQEVVPAMGVLSTAAGDIAAAAAPSEAKPAAQPTTSLSGIPVSGLRVASAAKSEEAEEAEEAVATLRPRIAPGEFHQQAAEEEEAPQLQIRGG